MGDWHHVPDEGVDETFNKWKVKKAKEDAKKKEKADKAAKKAAKKAGKLWPPPEDKKAAAPAVIYEVSGFWTAKGAGGSHEEVQLLQDPDGGEVFGAPSDKASSSDEFEIHGQVRSAPSPSCLSARIVTKYHLSVKPKAGGEKVLSCP
jgi:hypothetical protein